MKRFLNILAVVFAVMLGASAQDGSTAYNFLNVTSSARIYGLGGINITNVSDDISTVEQNPGLLGAEMSNQVVVNYMHYLGDSNFAGVRYGHSAGERGAWSAAIQYFGYGTIAGYDETGMPIGDFSPKDMAFSATYAHDITDRLRGGITLKFLYSSYEQYTALAATTDLGINYYDPDHDLSLSAVVANLGGQLKRFNETYDRLPVDFRLGFAKTFGTFPVRFSVTAWNLTKWHLPYYELTDQTIGSTTTDDYVIRDSFGSNLLRHLIFGADVMTSDRFYFTVAYNNKMRTDMATHKRNMLSGWSLGAGLQLNRFALSLAFAQPHTGATSLMVNLRLDFNDILNR